MQQSFEEAHVHLDAGLVAEPQELVPRTLRALVGSLILDVAAKALHPSLAFSEDTVSNVPSKGGAGKLPVDELAGLLLEIAAVEPSSICASRPIRRLNGLASRALVSEPNLARLLRPFAEDREVARNILPKLERLTRQRINCPFLPHCVLQTNRQLPMLPPVAQDSAG